MSLGRSFIGAVCILLVKVLLHFVLLYWADLADQIDGAGETCLIKNDYELRRWRQ